MRGVLRGGVAVGVVLGMSWAAWGQEHVTQRLENSPRHLEYQDVKRGDRTIRCFVAYPEVKEKATAVVVIHEIFGLADWVRGVTDQFAEAGYLAIAPDLLSGMGPNGGGTEAMGSGDAVRRAIVGLPPDQVTEDLKAVVEHVRKLPACNGKVVVAGFCWGGTQAFRFATNSDGIEAALVFYGTGPEDAAIGRIQAPVYGFYGENDARVNATIAKTEELMKAAGKRYEPVIYAGAGHGFMRAGEGPQASPANARAREEAWKRIRSVVPRS
ncbi:MAG: carboxymethylenebutenolidase [Isosphaeraceae bacterium]|jgi:carboxymethylenebutenolidase|nr:MAG: carboxymethylenebutenolidase [Isosphaeraceae bacterium]